MCWTTFRNASYGVANRHKANYNRASGLEVALKLKKIGLEAGAQWKGELDDEKPE
jgi:hypothetical protein